MNYVLLYMLAAVVSFVLLTGWWNGIHRAEFGDIGEGGYYEQYPALVWPSGVPGIIIGSWTALDWKEMCHFSLNFKPLTAKEYYGWKT